MEKIKEDAKRGMLPARSERIYLKHFQEFKEWFLKNGGKADEVDGDDLLAFFHSHRDSMSPTSMWSKYSAIKATLLAVDGIALTKTEAVTKFLKRNAETKKKKQAPVFSQEQLMTFVRNADDETELHTKLAVLFQFGGGLRLSETLSLEFRDVEALEDRLIIKIRESKTDQAGHGSTFVLAKSDDERTCPVSLFAKYTDRVGEKEGRLFRQLRNNKYTKQALGQHW